METKAGQGQSWGALCPGRKGCGQLDYAHGPLLPLSPCDHWQYQAQLISTPLWLCRPHCSRGPGHPCRVPASCCILSGERVMVPPCPARCALPTPGVLWVRSLAWGMNYCLDGLPQTGLGRSWQGSEGSGGKTLRVSSRADSVQQKPSRLLPSPRSLAPHRVCHPLPTSAHPRRALRSSWMLGEAGPGSCRACRL